METNKPTTTPKKSMDIALAHVNSLKTPLAVIEDGAVGQHFVDKFVLKNQVSPAEAKSYYHREKDNFVKRITQTPALKECTAVSIFVAFMQVGSWKLSFEEGRQSDVYLIPGNRNLSPNGQQAKWIKEVVAQPSPYGEKKIRISNGQLKKVSNPIIVRKGDIYKEELIDGEMIVSKYEKLSEYNAPIIGGFVVLTLPNGDKEYMRYDRSHIERWKAASAKKNKDKGANSLYTSHNGDIDEGFFEGKMLAHAFKGYPRVILPKMPEGFVPDAGAISGYDASEYQEAEYVNDDTAGELPAGNQETDEFDAAVAEAKEPDTGGATIQSDDDDESFFR